jgi:Haem-binding domain/Cytochrome P460
MTLEKSRLRKLLRFAVVCGFLFAVAQLVRPRLTNLPVTADLQAPPEVKEVLRNSCYSCHSNETKLPWFDQVVPAYWLVRNDVLEARRALNFSDVGALPGARQKAILFEAVNQMQLGAMPLPSYLAVHHGAVVTADQLAVLRNYLQSESAPTVSRSEEVAVADAQYRNWLANSATGPAATVADEPNGVKFVPDYKNWRAISSTERFDNGTMREILGNDIAVQAIAQGRINPWPDGTMFAKVTWHQQRDATGAVRTGAFLQVELMMRDQKKYSNTLGWGWGRWLGTDLKPYGKNPDFANECVGCHLPVRMNDSVYTLPIPGQVGGRR